VTETPELSFLSSLAEDTPSSETISHISVAVADISESPINITAPQASEAVLPSEVIVDPYVTGEFVSRKPLEASENINPLTTEGNELKEESVEIEEPGESWNSGCKLDPVVEEEEYVPPAEEAGMFHYIDGFIGWLDEPLHAFVHKVHSSKFDLNSLSSCISM
jgi:hypothetical protein